MSKILNLTAQLAFVLLVTACEPAPVAMTEEVATEPQTSGPTIDEAVAFVVDAEERLAVLAQNSERR